MKKLSLYIFLVLMFSLFTSHSFAVSFEKNCKVPKGSIKTIKIDGEKYIQFTLKDKDRGCGPIDNKSRHGAPYWERAELAQVNTLSKNETHEISFKVKITEGFRGERETFFQIHNYNQSSRKVYPSIMLKFDDGIFASTSTRPSNLQLDYMYADYQHRHLNRKDIPLANLKNEWQNFKIILSKIDKKTEIGYVTIYLNDKIIFENIKTYFPERGTPRIKYGIYRPGTLSTEKEFVATAAEKEFVAIAKNKKDNLFQMKSRKYFSMAEAENDVIKRCKLFFKPYGKNIQKNCFIDSISEIMPDPPILGNNTSKILYSKIDVESKK